ALPICGAGGALLVEGAGAPLVVPAPATTGGDPCGAGDRFSATAAGLLAAGALPSHAVPPAGAPAPAPPGGVPGAPPAAPASVAPGGAATVDLHPGAPTPLHMARSRLAAAGS